MPSTTPLKFYNVTQLPSTTVVGGLYFVNTPYHSTQLPNSGKKGLYLSTTTSKTGCIPVGLYYGFNDLTLPDTVSLSNRYAYAMTINQKHEGGYSGFNGGVTIYAGSAALYANDENEGVCSGRIGVGMTGGATSSSQPTTSASIWTDNMWGEDAASLSIGPYSIMMQYNYQWDYSHTMTFNHNNLVISAENTADGYTTEFNIDVTNNEQYNGDIRLGNNDIGYVLWSNIVNACATCFRGDTSYITMSDGSQKLIKDIKTGDVVRGYDVNKKEFTDAVVLQNVKTGEERAFDCYVMDDGTTVDIFNNDGFICKLDLHRKDKYGDKDGDYINLYSMKSLYSFHEKKDDQRKIIKEDGTTTCVIHKFTADCAKRTDRYTLYTSNGTFFVNGLLHGLASRSIPHHFKSHRITTPDYITKIFDQILLDLAEKDESLPDTHIKNPDKAEDLAILNKAKATIAWAKNKLSETDYKYNKYAEGALTEEEWLPVKAQRAEWRKVVNDNEDIVSEYTEKVKKYNPEILNNIDDIPDHIKRHNLWIEHQKVYDDNYNLFKQWTDEIIASKNAKIEEARREMEVRKAKQKSTKKED